MNIKSFFNNCNTIFDVVNILNEYAQQGKLKLFYTPNKDGLNMPIQEGIWQDEINLISSVQVTDCWERDEVYQEITFTDAKTGKNWAATIFTDIHNEYEDRIIPNGIKIEYTYDIDCLDNHINRDYVVRTKGKDYELKANIFVMIID